MNETIYNGDFLMYPSDDVIIGVFADCVFLEHWISSLLHMYCTVLLYNLLVKILCCCDTLLA